MQKLELTWIGKEQEPAVEPRILLHDPSRDYGDPKADNMLIHGDNLLALQALEQEFTGRVKCIYIDPPYNTGAAFEHYDDNLEHSIWLSLMRCRLKILRNLLSEDGSIYIQIDNSEQAYLKVIMDEIFQRKNFVQMISVKRASPAGFKVINPGPLTVTEYVLLYAKNKDMLCYNPQRIPVGYDSNYNLFIKNPDDPPEEWVLGKLTDFLYQRWNITTWQEARQRYGESWKVIRDAALADLALELKDSVVSVRDPHKPSDLIKRTMDKSKQNRDRIFVIPRENYTPVYIYNGGSLSFYRDKLREIDGALTPTELLTDFWADINYAGIANEGGVQFKNSKKPEMLLRRVIELATNPGDLVLDSFLGSGTTAAVAHKMGRRYIGIELGDHCYTHCLTRLKAVVDGEQGGISKAVNWQGGGGFKFYELAPTLIVKDENGFDIISDRYAPMMLAAAVAKLCGYRFTPREGNPYVHGENNVGGFLFVTTQYITAPLLGEIAKHFSDTQSLVICTSAFQVGIKNNFPNIKLRKIPQSVLSKCEYGANNYNLNVVELPNFDEIEVGFEDAE
jgi:adenine-specific DNA-methyltransferase